MDKVIAEDEEGGASSARRQAGREEREAEGDYRSEEAKKEVDPQMLKDLKALDAKVKEAERDGPSSKKC